MGRRRDQGSQAVLTRPSFQVTHATDVDTNAERAFVVRELTEHGGIGPVRFHLPGERLSLGTVNRYVSDGLVAVADLRQHSSQEKGGLRPP